MSKRLWTPEKVICEIRLLHKAGNDLSYGSAFEAVPKLVSAAGRCFRSWGRAVESAGFDYSALAKAAHNRSRAKRAKWSRERIVEHIQRAADRNEPLQAAVASRMHPDLYGAACNPRYYGGWTKALAAAGIKYERLKPGTPGKHAASLAQWREDLLFERIGQLVGREHPEEHDMQALAPMMHESLIQRFGSWTEVLRAAEGAAEPKRRRRRKARRGQQ